MIGLLLGNWRLIGVGLIALAVGGYIWHAESVKAKWAEAQAIAEQQQRENAKQALRDLKAKERADENYERNISRLDADVKRLRQHSASLLPAATTAPAGAPRACYERAELDTALREYRDAVARGREEIRRILGEGAAAVEGLDTAKQWAKDFPPP